MTQYVLQILDSTQQLIKCYEVTAESPIRPVVPTGRTQAIITDTQLFNEAVAAYKQYGTAALYSWDGVNLEWTIP